jgi:hypothetical protein
MGASNDTFFSKFTLQSLQHIHLSTCLQAKKEKKKKNSILKYKLTTKSLMV